MPMPTHSDFARLEDELDENLEKQMGRVESKLDALGQAVQKLIVVEERQTNHAVRITDMAARLDALRAEYESRAKGMGERFDARTSALETKVERITAIAGAGAVAIGAVWTVASHFVH